MKKTSGWLWGAVLVIIGVILGVNALGLARINIFFPGWWTLFIIVPCAIGLFTDEHKGGPIVGLVLGVCLLLSRWGILPFGIFWKLLIPVLLVVIGVGMIVRSSARGEVQDKIRKAQEMHREERHKHRHIVEAEVVEDDDEEDEDSREDTKTRKSANSHKSADREDDERYDSMDTKEYWSTFGNQEIDYDDKEFVSCRIDAVFGGADLDLRKAKIKDEAVVRLSCVFGGIIVYVPDNVRVEVASSAIFGGVSDKRKEAKKAAKKSASVKTLYIDASCVFGSVEIR